MLIKLNKINKIQSFKFLHNNILLHSGLLLSVIFRYFLETDT